MSELVGGVMGRRKLNGVEEHGHKKCYPLTSISMALIIVMKSQTSVQSSWRPWSASHALCDQCDSLRERNDASQGMTTSQEHT